LGLADAALFSFQPLAWSDPPDIAEFTFRDLQMGCSTPKMTLERHCPGRLLRKQYIDKSLRVM
jgi:hypothetical protein